MDERQSPIDSLPVQGSYDQVNGRSRVHMESGRSHRNQVPRRPNMEVRDEVSDYRRARMFENTHQSQHYTSSPTIVTERPPVERHRGHYTRGHYGEENFEGIPRSGGSRSRHSNQEYDDIEDERYVVPALPMPVAIICCVLNFILPGFGSMTASVCLLCCGKTDDMTGKEKCGSCLTVFGIGLLQLILVACFLIGWIWSCIWGVTFIGMSANFYDEEEEQQDHERERHHNHNGTSTSGRLPTPQVVTDQPFPGVRYEDIHRDRTRRRREQRSRHTRSRISITPSNLIYPMRAPSNIAYNSPPPSYQESENERIRNRQQMSRTRRSVVAQPSRNHLTIPEDTNG